jgi:hypothetical protein
VFLLKLFPLGGRGMKEGIQEASLCSIEKLGGGRMFFLHKEDAEEYERLQALYGKAFVKFTDAQNDLYKAERVFNEFTREKELKLRS